MADRRDKFAFHAINALEFGDVIAEREKPDDLVLLVAFAVTRKVVHHVFTQLTAGDNLLALLTHRIARQSFQHVTLYLRVKLRTHDFRHRFVMDVFSRQAKRFFIRFVVKREALVFFNVGNQRRDSVGELARLSTSLSESFASMRGWLACDRTIIRIAHANTLS